MGTILIRGGRVIDPASGRDEVTDVLIEGPRIARVGGATRKADEVIEADGLIVAPGLIDMHVHLREPGKQEEETIASGSAAAIAGGFTTVACMPNTEPVVDNEASAEFVFLQAERAGLANIYPIGAITKRQEGRELAEIGQLSRAGAVAFSDDGFCVADAGLMLQALDYARMFDKPIIDHCEDVNLSLDGVMHEGYYSMALGLPGIPAASEEVMVGRDLILAEMTKGHLHVAHVSTRGSVELIRQAKARGVNVTCEVTAHHFALTDECVTTFDPRYKMNPPLRTAEDAHSLREALADGTIDCIVSDHAPHATEEKQVEFSHAPFGVIGMESLLPVVVKTLIEPGVVTWPQAVAAMTINPARILRLPKGALTPGADADLTLIDPKVSWTIDAKQFRSKSRNCPFDGWPVTGRAHTVIVAGELKQV